MPASSGWCPFAQQHRTVKFWPGNKGRKAVVIHIAEGGFNGSLSWLRDEHEQSSPSAHFLIAKDGRIAQLVSINDSAWANGLTWKDNRWFSADGTSKVNPRWVDIVPGVNPNWYTISIEHEGRTGESLTPEMQEATLNLLKWIASATGIVYVVGRTLIGHCDISPTIKKDCPGVSFVMARIAQQANVGGDADAAGVNEDSGLLCPPRAAEQQAISFINARGSYYNPNDIGVIVGHYWRYAPEVGLDPLLAVAQCIHETSELDPQTGTWRPLSQWWAQRPRRNPAGIGVNGMEQQTRPADTTGWQEDTSTDPPTWRAGLAFESWDVSVRAQLGRLLAYALPQGQENQAQRDMIDFALAFRPLPANMRGSAPTLKPLGAAHNPTGQGWAFPGDKYGERIAQIARAIQNS